MSVMQSRTVTLRDGAEVLLRSPTEHDAAALVNYLDRVRRETEFIMFDPADRMPTLDEERAWVRSSRDDALALKILAEAGGEIVALCDVTAGRGLVRMRHVGTIGISILAAWCDRGLGTLLMRELVGWARRQPEITVLRLSVFGHNARAAAVYRKAGFVEEGTHRWAVRYRDGRYADEISMSMWLGGDAERREVAR